MSPKMWNIGNYRVYKLEEALDIENQSSIPPSHFLSSVYTLQGLRGMLITPKSWTYSQCIPELGHNLMNCPRNMQLRLEINPGLFTCSGVPVPNWSAFQSLSHVLLFVTPWTAALQASLSFTISQNLLKLMLIESGMPSNHLALCRPLLLRPSIWSGCSLKVGRTRYGAEFQALPWYYGMSTGRGVRTSGFPHYLALWTQAMHSGPQTHSLISKSRELNSSLSLIVVQSSWFYDQAWNKATRLF